MAPYRRPELSPAARAHIEQARAASEQIQGFESQRYQSFARRTNAVLFALAEDASLGDIARELGVSTEAVRQWVGQTVLHIDASSGEHTFPLTAGPDTGQVWIPLALADNDPNLSWVRDLDIPASAVNGTDGPPIVRVPRWEWDKAMGPTE